MRVTQIEKKGRQNHRVPHRLRPLTVLPASGGCPRRAAPRMDHNRNTEMSKQAPSSRWLVSHRMARATPRRSRHGRGRRIVLSSGPQARCRRRISRRPYSRRGAFRHRRGRRPLQSPAAHATERRRIRTRGRPPRHRRHRHRRGLRRGRARRCTPGVVDVSRVRSRERVHSRRRPPEVEGRRPTVAEPAGSSARRAGSTPGSTANWLPAPPTCGVHCRNGPRRWSTRGRPTAFAARRRSRGRACARVTCRAH